MKPISSPHLPVASSVPAVMRTVLLALLPGIAVYTTLFGIGVLLNLLLCAAGSLAAEAVWLRLRGRDLKPLADWTAAITGLLLALALPPLAPWWVPLLGGAFAIVLGKQLYGGLGYNPFNPAMVGYVILLISFPLEMTRWPAPNPLWAPVLSLREQLQFVFGGWPAASDAISSATPLDALRTGLSKNRALSEIAPDGATALLAMRGGLWVALAYLAGGLWLIRKRIIGWQIPLGLLAALALIALPFWAWDADRYASPLFHLLAGAAMLGAFFIATDPVSAATTPRGRLYFGAGIGVLTYVIRTWGGYPDAIAFAVLLMNIAVPLIDRYTPPRVYGQRRERAP